MAVSEKIIEKYIVKPSSPTPNNFKNYKLNFMDQISPPLYMPFVFFYQNDEYKPNQHVEISQLLKESLSQILTIFYPLAGKILENSFVDCNDTGIEFIEARVHARLAQVIEDPKIEELKKLFPVESSSHNDNAILVVKVSFFDCGGIAIGVCLSHKIADFSSFILFMKAWAAQCRGETEFTRPSFDLAARFPPKDSTPPGFTPAEDNFKTNRLVFDREMVETIKKQIASWEVKNPTTVEAITIFIWKNFIDSTKAILGSKRSSFAALHVVNLRPRAIPPIPNNSFGNCGVGCFAFTSNPTLHSHDLLPKLRSAIRAVDDSYIKKLTIDEYFKMKNEAEDWYNSGADLCSFTSLLRFPAYEVDFGWGTPVWVCTTTVAYKNNITLMSTPSGDGVEAWINMSEDFFQMLKANYDRLQKVSC